MNFKNKSISPCGSFWDDFFKKKHREVSESFIKNSAKNTCFPFFFFWNIKKNWHREKVRGVTSARGFHGSKSLTPGSPFRISPHRSSFPPCGENQFRSFDPRPRREVRNGGWFHRLELLLWVSWDFVNVAFGGKVVTPQGWSAFANILYVYRSIYKYIYIAYIPAVPNHLHPKKLT